MMGGWLKFENKQGNPNMAFWGFPGQGKTRWAGEEAPAERGTRRPVVTMATAAGGKGSQRIMSCFFSFLFEMASFLPTKERQEEKVVGKRKGGSGENRRQVWSGGRAHLCTVRKSLPF